MTKTIFYSWQSDLPNRTNRGLIEKALEQAAKQLRAEHDLDLDPVIDRDTRGEPGAPDIARTILKKINLLSEADRVYTGGAVQIQTNEIPEDLLQGFGILPVSPSLDVDGDRVHDLWIGSPLANATETGLRTNAGRIYLVSGQAQTFDLSGETFTELAKRKACGEAGYS